MQALALNTKGKPIMAIRTIINIKRDEYDSFVSLIGSDDNLPASYEEWQEIRTKQIENYSSGRDVLQFVTVDYNVFVKYLRDSGTEATYFLLSSVFGALATQGKWPVTASTVYAQRTL
jgi:hypothetical protein